MIVRDEVRTIAQTLASVAGVCDLAVLLDTGSTDGTPEIAAQAAAELGLAIEIHHAPFVDFAAARNQVLSLLGERATWALTLDGDEMLRGGKDLWQHLADARDATGMMVDIEYGQMRFASPRICRTGSGWRWVGEVHELLSHPHQHPAYAPQGVSIFHDLNGDPTRRARRMREFDLPTLQRIVQERPDDARAAFYLAQTYEGLGDADKALLWYQQRSRMVGWPEETFIAALRAAQIARSNDNFLRAYALAPHRVEALCGLALMHYQREQWAPCHLFARAACALPLRPPKGLLFVDTVAWEFTRWDLLSVSAWHLGQYQEGEDAASRALAARPDDARCAANLAYYTGRRAA